MSKYLVKEDVEILGEVRAANSEVEIDEETAAPFVAEGKLEALNAPSDPAAPTASEAPAPEAPAAPTSETPAAPEAPAGETAPSAPADGGENSSAAPEKEEKEWAGGHTV